MKINEIGSSERPRTDPGKTRKDQERPRTDPGPAEPAEAAYSRFARNQICICIEFLISCALTRLCPQGAGRIEPAERYTASPHFGKSNGKGSCMQSEICWQEKQNIGRKKLNAGISRI